MSSSNIRIGKGKEAREMVGGDNESGKGFQTLA